MSKGKKPKSIAKTMEIIVISP